MRILNENEEILTKQIHDIYKHIEENISKDNNHIKTLFRNYFGIGGKRKIRKTRKNHYYSSTLLSSTRFLSRSNRKSTRAVRTQKAR